MCAPKILPPCYLLKCSLKLRAMLSCMHVLFISCQCFLAFKIFSRLPCILYYASLQTF